MNLKNCSLEQVDTLYRNGYISEKEALEYIEEWNKGPHLTYTVLRDGKIRNYLRKD